VDEPLPAGLIGDIALPEERQWIDRAWAEDPGVNWDRLLFSIKESIYKAWFPLARTWLGFEDAGVAIDRANGIFAAHLLVPGPTLGGRKLDGFRGRWLAAEGLLLSAIALPAS
jgi:4'-phosphopantetheinyl transferase EntD